MRIPKSGCYFALVAAFTTWVWGCGNSASSGPGSAGATSSQAGSTSSAGSLTGPGAAGSANTMNSGQAGSASGGSGSHAGGASATAGSANGGSGASSGGASAMAGATASPSAGSGNAGATGSGTPVKSAGCGKPAPLSAVTQQSVMIDSAARGYVLVPPAPYDNGTPYAVVFAFHGSGNSGAGFRPSFEAETANRAIFVYPDGVGGVWDLKNNGSDAKLFDSILATLSANWCIDTGAVFAFGFSYGGWAATQMASARPTAVRAIASVEGGGPQGSSNGDPPVAAIIIHGKNDTAEPLASGQSSRDHFIKIDGCGSAPVATPASVCVTYDGCKPKKSVVWCEHEGAHEVPGFAPAAIWGFFESMR